MATYQQWSQSYFPDLTLEEVADSWEGEFADPKVTTTQDDYAECVDSLVDRLKSTK